MSFAVTHALFIILAKFIVLMLLLNRNSLAPRQSEQGLIGQRQYEQRQGKGIKNNFRVTFGKSSIVHYKTCVFFY